MIEILHPVDDKIRIAELASRYDVVDPWEAARDELIELGTYDTVSRYPDIGDPDLITRYVAYPWRKTLVRLPDAETFYRLRTARNRYLITDDEQRRWRDAVVAVAGLSVGASVLHACAMTGARTLRIADSDTLGPTNLNRLAGSVCDLGVPKATLAARRLLETDPYADVTAFGDGVTVGNIGAFLGGDGQRPVDIVLEEVDDLAMKVEIRRQARARGIPVVMVTDDGDNVIVDVERYDLDPGYPLFHGRAGDTTDLDPAALRDPDQRVRIAGAIVGGDISPRMSVALGQVGRTIPSWPQLGTASTLAGAVGAATARRILCDAEVPSGRHRITIDDL
ncbi:thiamine biosynthesis protein ThiF [Gordonia pseudamarae]|uniref:Thiamine biosynthesis protein ThiF n=1 Tax=Gordonia pseudamarae TaxID=2831662 RepID=A0ABX6IEA1_9ACTN|nr:MULTISPECIES: ThiF family adenylyltransferase [Gordonia]MBD0022808.1 ThiF family adenylyltransferase [Gordonia sp. (in: high G+C Gram-positive bacteria)]QHN24680.1 thiamine biosynthesis protein ThiF [Gordonia pseudamarae]QHN33610.1 thiamine biosynthesis protein ThiF [Gordonia pseudamarae]